MKILIGFCLLAVAFAARPEVKKTCTEKPESGVCMAYFRMWYYDPETESCKKFIYGGCQGNGNRYESEEECLDNCKDVKSEQQLSVASAVDCNAMPEPGVCDAYMPRYYYNPLEGSCKRFIYGGCGGNSNNFRTEEECNAKCGGDSDVESAIPFPFTCDCESGNSTCSCCGQMFIPSIKLDQKACVEVSFNTDKKALKVEIKMNKKVVFSNTLSARNPPPVCVGMPSMSLFADVCFDFYDIKVNREEIHFCLNIKPRLIRKEVSDFKVGCFNFNRNKDDVTEE